jgi:putative acetyltransferase
MYVLPERRRDGIARALLAALESQAQALCYRALKLETGHKQRPAMALYQSFGFRRIAPFGPYVDDPTSVCFEKDIG